MQGPFWGQTLDFKNVPLDIIMIKKLKRANIDCRPDRLKACDLKDGGSLSNTVNHVGKEKVSIHVPF